MDTQCTRQAITQNLADAGCGEALIGQFWQLLTEGKRQKGLDLLAGHRQSLLDHCHETQRKIDCLDYLIYQLNCTQHEEELHHGRKADFNRNLG